VLSLFMAWGASVLVTRPPQGRFTYGFKSSSILAALGNAALLLVALGAILVESLRRLMQPEAGARPGDDRGGDRHCHQHLHRAAVHARQRARSQRARRLSA
jgi:divalent metal cation (Fe/Co/Zn/Cd) transporter